MEGETRNTIKIVVSKCHGKKRLRKRRKERKVLLRIVSNHCDADSFTAAGNDLPWIYGNIFKYLNIMTLILSSIS
jgi:hypothetical protein